jgi:prevent-host-death family protein
MKTIGVRQLRQQASRYLREVEAGETIQVTDRGRPVAMLVPVPAEGPLSRLVSSGRLIPAEGDLLELGEPLEPAPGVTLPSEELARMRKLER